jgi:hypothetical protein
VFFTTRDQLSPRDHDGLMDVYDAREGGGIAAESEIAGSGCQGEECQSTVLAPETPPPGSLGFQGSGNLLAPLSKPADSVAPRAEVSTRAKLAKALRACRKDKSRSKRVLCERGARKRYGSKPKTKAKSRKGGK